MKTTILFVFALSFSSILFSQNFDWAFNIGVDIKTLTVDNEGSIIIAGDFTGVVDINPGQDTLMLGADGTHSFVAKYSFNGNLIWGFGIGNPLNLLRINIIRSDINNNIYIGGQFRYTDFDPSQDTFFLTSSYAESMFIAKYSPSGQFINAIGFADGGDPMLYYRTLWDFQLDSAGNIYSTGFLLDYPMDFDPSGDSLILQSLSGNPEIFIAKYTIDLSLVWAKRIGSNGANGYQWTYSLALNNAGTFFIGGLFARDSVDFDPSPNTSFYLTPYPLANYDDVAFVASYDTSGAFHWARKMPSPDMSVAWNIDACSNGDLLVSGFFETFINLSPLSTTPVFLSSAAGSLKLNPFLARFNASGDLLWGRGLPSRGNIYQLAKEDDISGNIVVAGTFKDTLFPWGINQTPMMVPYGVDMFMATYSPLGQLLCVQTLDAPNYSFSLKDLLTNEGNMYIGGTFSGNLDFDPGPGTHFLNATNGPAFLAKYKLNTGIETFKNPQTSYLVFPNPTANYLTIQTKDNTPLPQGTLQIFNMQGVLLMEQAISKSQNQLHLNLSHLPDGLYLGRFASSSGDREGFQIVKYNFE